MYILFAKSVAQCPPGTYQTEDSNTGIQVCLDCPKGMYQTEIGRTQCTPCPTNRTTEFAGTRSDSRCFCKLKLIYLRITFHYHIFSAL